VSAHTPGRDTDLSARVVDDVEALRERLAPWRQRGGRVGMVPTMGNLHAGHLSLVDKAIALSDVVVVSIFVNPLQFGPEEDFGAYPRTLDDDLQALASVDGAALEVFLPPVGQVYPFGEEQAVRVSVPGLSDDLCGRHRPGHFDGVATVVTKLLNMVQPHVAVFGEKDLQQLRVIERLAQDLCLPTRIVPARIAREDDGLAMSSRNRYLTRPQRALAPMLYQELEDVCAALRAGRGDYGGLESVACARLREAGFRPDYVAVRRYADLALPGPSDRELVVLGAAWLGDARLIDNVAVGARSEGL
jgi:pantoate--beta-alanine ligase